LHHYPHNIGDFDKATRHLTRIERSIYRDLIELYYDTEQQLTLDTAALCRLILARTNEESTAVEQTLNEFFTKTPTGWYHHRCEVELDKYRANASQKSLAGRASALKKAAKAQEALNGRSTDVERTNNGASTKQNGELELELETSKSKAIVASDAGRPPCPHKEILAIFHEILPSAVAVRDWTPARAALLKARWCEDENRQNLEFWKNLFEYIAGVPFLMGRSSSPGRKPFLVSLPWLVKAENFAKVREGNYE